MTSQNEVLEALHSALSDMTSNIRAYMSYAKDRMSQQEKKILELTATLEQSEIEKKEYETLFEEASKLQKDSQQQTEYHQKLLYAEMSKVDNMQVELELAQRERDIALRKQGITSEQKQLLVKMEYESYKINETIERIDHIATMVRTILETEA